MNALDYNKVVIFSYPRAGTKLLSKIFGQFGYTEYGEWFDTYSTSVNTGVAKRIVAEKQTKMQDFCRDKMDQSRYYHIDETLHRFDKFSFHDGKAIITLWSENLENCPFILNKLDDSLWLLPQRDAWSQLLSFMIAHDNQNFNTAGINNSIVAKKWLFKLFYWKRKRTLRTQDWISKNLNSLVIPFESLVGGTYEGFGKEYSITSSDENLELESMILNLDEVKSWFSEFEQDFENATKFILQRPFDN